MAGTKHDNGKVRLSLVSVDGIEEVGKVATFGSLKYNDHNWRQGFDWSRLLDAAYRHMNQFNNGDRKDFKASCKKCKKGKCKNHSGLSHLAHAAWNLLALIEFEKNEQGVDDLWKGYKKKPAKRKKKK